ERGPPGDGAARAGARGGDHPGGDVRLALALLAASAAWADDYDLSANWNGLSTLIGEAQQAGCEVTAPGLLDWSVVGPHDTLFFVYPEVAVDGGRLKRFLAQ